MYRMKMMAQRVGERRVKIEQDKLEIEKERMKRVKDVYFIFKST